MKESIKLTDALKEMTRRNIQGALIPFNIKVRSFNVRNKSGGKLISYRNVTMIPFASEKRYEEKEEILSDPSHFDNRTRNLRTENGDHKKIHIDFIIELNGKTVIY